MAITPSMALIIIAAVCLQFITAYEVKLKCTNIDEFYYAKPGSHCTKYYKCNRGHKNVRECDPGSMFDFYRQACTRNKGVCYEPICTGRANGIYQDTAHACRRSFACHTGRVVSIDNCPPSHLHNGQQCIHQELVMCELPQTTTVGYPFSGDRRCIGKADGTYGMNDCTNYVICQNEEVADIKFCPNGHRFKTEIQQCAIADHIFKCSSDSICSENVCKFKNDGPNFDPHSLDCKTYIMCKSGKFLSREKCTNQAVFNGEYCVPNPLYTCPALLNSSEDDICEQQENGLHMNPGRGCSSYVRCMSRKTVENYDCPNGQYFDPEERNCFFEKFHERRKCIPRNRSRDCLNVAQGFYQDKSEESDCTKYYYCLNGYKTEYKCSSGKVFDGENCVSNSSYNCPIKFQNSCSNRSDGYYVDRESGCRSFYYCSNGNKITYLCEEGYVFDGTRCSRSSLIEQNHECHSDESCVGKSDGYHSDLKSHCRDYMYCLRGQKVTQITCRGSKVFDGEKCVSSSLHTCPSNSGHQQLNCVIKQCPNCSTDGFFPDIESGCQKYYFCIGGKRSALQCTAGQIFNGQICVPQDQFNCPVYCLIDSISPSRSKILNCPPNK